MRSIRTFRRLQNGRIFCECERRSIFERKVWSECKNDEGEWGETLKNTTIRFAIQKRPKTTVLQSKLIAVEDLISYDW